MINPKRYRKLNNRDHQPGIIVYLMNRDKRVKHNWALLLACEIAKKENRKLKVLHFINSEEKLIYSNEFLPYMHYKFLFDGLRELEDDLKNLNINLEILVGKDRETLFEYLKKSSVGILITDFIPLKNYQKTIKYLAEQLPIPIYEVDSHNIVPCWITSNKQEFGAYTIRYKIQKLLIEFLDDFPDINPLLPSNFDSSIKTNWENLIKSIRYSNVNVLNWITGGEQSAWSTFQEFLEHKLEHYYQNRNNPSKNVLSNLSPFINYGFISAQKIALILQNYSKHKESVDSFLEEMIIRRELTDNFCYYNTNYDSFDGFPEWAKQTLNKHRFDKREFIYTLEEFENAKTHDDLWNAAQIEMTKKGKMHGYMRMYWAKKILEWSESPEKAYEYALYLNDKYELDGRDPNGIVGCAWSIGGVHDRPWFERPIFGKIRYMSYDGCKRKFDVKKYIEMCKKL